VVLNAAAPARISRCQGSSSRIPPMGSVSLRRARVPGPATGLPHHKTLPLHTTSRHPTPTVRGSAVWCLSVLTMSRDSAPRVLHQFAGVDGGVNVSSDGCESIGRASPHAAPARDPRSPAHRSTFGERGVRFETNERILKVADDLRSDHPIDDNPLPPLEGHYRTLSQPARHSID